jgi:hypothetical protein
VTESSGRRQSVGVKDVLCACAVCGTVDGWRWHGLLDARWALGFYDRRPNIIIKIKKKTSNQLMAPRPPGTDSEFAI